MNDLQMTEVVNYSTQLGEEPNLSDLNNHQMSISEQIKKIYYYFTDNSIVF
jgi:hypothetical protein